MAWTIRAKFGIYMIFAAVCVRTCFAEEDGRSAVKAKIITLSKTEKNYEVADKTQKTGNSEAGNTSTKAQEHPNVKMISADDIKAVAKMQIKGDEKAAKFFKKTMDKIVLRMQNDMKPSPMRNLNEFIQGLLTLLVRNDVLDVRASIKITDAIEANRTDEGRDKHKLTSNKTSQLEINGDAAAKEEFIQSLNKMLDDFLASKLTPKTALSVLARAIIKLTIGNDLLVAEDGEKLVAIIVPSPDPPPAAEKKITFSFIVSGDKEAAVKFMQTATSILQEKMSKNADAHLDRMDLIYALLELLLGNEIFTAKQAHDLSATFELTVEPHRPHTRTGGKVLTPTAAKRFRVGGEEEPADVFVQALVKLLDKAVGPMGPKRVEYIVQMLTDLAIGNGIITNENATLVLSSFANVEDTDSVNVTWKVEGDAEGAVAFMKEYKKLLKNRKGMEDAIKIILKLLVKNDIFADRVASQVAITFGLPYDSESTPKVQALATKSVPGLAVAGKPEAKKIFLTGLEFVIRRKSAARDEKNYALTICKLLIDLLIGNGLITETAAIDFISSMGFNISPADVSAGTAILQKIGFDTKSVQGSALGEAQLYATFATLIAQKMSHSNSLKSYCTLLLTFLVDNRILAEDDKFSLLITFGVLDRQEAPDQNVPIYTASNIISMLVGGKPEVVDEFLVSLEKILQKKLTSATSGIEQLISPLLQLLIQNDIFSAAHAEKLTSQFSVELLEKQISTSITKVEVKVAAKEAAVGKLYEAAKRYVVAVKALNGKHNVTEVKATLVNLLLHLLVDTKIITAQISADLVVTFGYADTGEYPIQATDAKTLTVASIDTLAIAGNATAKASFVATLQKLITEEDRATGPMLFADALLKLIVGNTILIQGMADTIKKSFTPFCKEDVEMFVITVNATETVAKRFRTAVVGFITAKEASSRSVIITITTLTNLLLNLFVEQGVLDAQTAVNIAGTFGSNTGLYPLDGNAKLLTTLAQLKELKIEGNTFAKEKLSASLNVLFDRKMICDNGESEVAVTKQVSAYAKSLLQFALDNNLLDSQNAEKLGTKFGVSKPTKKLSSSNDLDLRVNANADVSKKFMDNVFRYASSISVEEVEVNAATVINIVAQLLQNNGFFDEITGPALVKTFGMKNMAKYQLDKDVTDVELLTPAQLAKLKLKGSEAANRHLLSSLAYLADKSSIPGESATVKLYSFANILLQYAVEQNVLDEVSAEKICNYFGIFYLGQWDDSVCKSVTNLVIKSTKITSDITEYLQSVETEFVPVVVKRTILINLILQLLIENQILDADNAARLVATFGRRGVGKYEIKSTKFEPLTSETIMKLRIKSCSGQSDKVLMSNLKILLEKVDRKESDENSATITSAFAKVLLRLSMDCGIVDERTASTLARNFEIHFTGENVETIVERVVYYKTNVKEFLDEVSVSVEYVAATAKSQCSVFTNQIIRLLLKNKVLSEQVISDLVATFGIQDIKLPTEGLPGAVYTASSVEGIKVSGTLQGQANFVSSVKTLLQQGQSSKKDGTCNIEFLHILLRLVVTNNLLESTVVVGIAKKYGIKIEVEVISATFGACCGGFEAALDVLMQHEDARKYLDVSTKSALNEYLSKKIREMNSLDDSCYASESH